MDLLKRILAVFVVLCFVTVSGFANGLPALEQPGSDEQHPLVLLVVSYASMLGGLYLVSEGYAPFGYYCLACGVVLFANFVVEAGKLVNGRQPTGLDEYFGVSFKVRF